MNYFAGLDVSLEWTSVCVVDADGGIVREAKVVSEHAALAAFFTGLDSGVTRICWRRGRCRNGSMTTWPRPGSRWFAPRRGS